MFNSKIFLAELIGTFALVFIGAGAGMVGADLVGVALAHGLTVAIFIYAYGHISGTHINPAVTVALTAVGRVQVGTAVVSYLLPQFAGAALAGFLLNTIAGAIGGSLSFGATVGALTLNTPWLAMVVELVLTFFLVNTIFNTAVSGKGGNFSGLAIGLTLVAAILVGGPLTGASLNPARTFGVAIFSDPSLANTNTYLVYLMAPLLGATLAAYLYLYFNGEEEETEAESENVPAAVAVEEKPAPKRVVRRSTSTTKRTSKK